MIRYVVGDLTEPTAQPFVVLKVDTSIRREGGVEATVVSLHWRREEAELVCKQLERKLQ